MDGPVIKCDIGMSHPFQFVSVVFEHFVATGVQSLLGHLAIDHINHYPPSEWLRWILPRWTRTELHQTRTRANMESPGVFTEVMSTGSANSATDLKVFLLIRSGLDFPRKHDQSHHYRQPSVV
jgi:hypothetical protein